MAGRHAALVDDRSIVSPGAPPPAFVSRRARRDAEEAAAHRAVAERHRIAVRRPAGPLAARATVAPQPSTKRSSAGQPHPIGVKRLALLLVPALAITTGIALTSPANAEPLPAHFQDAARATGQSYRVASDVAIPVVDAGTTTIVSVPSVVVSGGASVSHAQTSLAAALSQGGARATVLQTALTYLGDTYVEGGASHQGIDCSGLVMVAYQAVGIQLAHYVPSQDAVATTIPESEAQPGDLVVYDNEDHIGLYLGQGLVLQAPHPGEPVDIIPMFSAPHHFARLLPAS